MAMSSRPHTGRNERALAERPRTRTRTRGTYHCACCRCELFSSDAQFEFGTGCWPNFTVAVSEAVVEIVDKGGAAWSRQEVVCGGCKCHLGHVFSDGPGRSAERYCIEWRLLRFAPDGTYDASEPHEGPRPDWWPG